MRLRFKSSSTLLYTTRLTKTRVPVGLVIEVLADLESLGREDCLEGLLLLSQDLHFLLVVVDLLRDGVDDFLYWRYS